MLADARYAKPMVHQRLPQWISERLRVPASFDEALTSMVGPFFARRAGEQCAIEDSRRRRAEGHEG